MKNIRIYYSVIVFALIALTVGCKSESTHEYWTNGRGTIIHIDTIQRGGVSDSLQVFVGFEYKNKFHVAKKTYAFTDTISMWEDREIMVDSLKPWYIVVGKQLDESIAGIDSLTISGRLNNTKGNKVRARLRNKYGQRTFYFDNGFYYVVVDNTIDNQLVLDGVDNKVKYLNIHGEVTEAPSLVNMDANFMLSYDTVRADLIFDWNEDSWLFEARE